MEYFTTPFFISELLAALVATFCFYKYRHTPLWLILPILWMAPITESLGVYYYEYIYPNNAGIFNLYQFVYFVLFYLMIYGFVKNRTRQLVIISLSVLVLLTYSIEFSITDVQYKPLTYSGIVGTMVMVIHLMYAAIETLKSNKILDFRNSLPFFIFSGYLLIEITLIPVSLIRNQDLNTWSIDVIEGVRSILGAVLILANGYFIFGFLWTKSMGKKE